VRNGDGTRASAYSRVADEWAGKVQGWTATTNGPFSPRPYFLRLTVDGKPDEGTTYAIGDSGPADADQRRVVDTGFLELVRLGVLKPDDPVVVNSLAVADAQLRGHRYTDDGYGEQRDGGPWGEFPASSQQTLGRLWPVLTGERGEYELAAGRPASAQLAALAASANDGGMLPEQVWDGRAPSTKAGGGTRSATPFGWAHAELVRLAWSVAAGRPVERPGIVACHYAGVCS
jgi:glucoamylase